MKCWPDLFNVSDWWYKYCYTGSRDWRWYVKTWVFPTLDTYAGEHHHPTVRTMTHGAISKEHPNTRHWENDINHLSPTTRQPCSCKNKFKEIQVKLWYFDKYSNTDFWKLYVTCSQGGVGSHNLYTRLLLYDPVYHDYLVLHMLLIITRMNPSWMFGAILNQHLFCLVYSDIFCCLLIVYSHYSSE